MDKISYQDYHNGLLKQVKISEKIKSLYPDVNVVKYGKRYFFYSDSLFAGKSATLELNSEKYKMYISLKKKINLSDIEYNDNIYIKSNKIEIGCYKYVYNNTSYVSPTYSYSFYNYKESNNISKEIINKIDNKITNYFNYYLKNKINFHITNPELGPKKLQTLINFQ